jgi:MFS family permease
MTMRISNVVRTLVLSDFLINSGFGVFAPIFAIFVTRQISGGSIEVVGYAAAIAQIFKSGLQLPIAKILDKNRGEKADFYSMVFGSMILSVTPFLYLFASESIHIYIIQAIFGIGAAFSIPPWYTIFSHHLDKGHSNLEWSMDSVAIGISTAIAAALGGIFASRFGFQFVFLLAGMLAIFGSFQQIRIFRHLKSSIPAQDVHPKPPKIAN